MKKTAITLSALLLSAAAQADFWTGNDDLYGWVLADDHAGATPTLTAAPGGSDHFGSPDDLYGWVVNDPAPRASGIAKTHLIPYFGGSELQGSILVDVGVGVPRQDAGIPIADRGAGERVADTL